MPSIAIDEQFAIYDKNEVRELLLAESQRAIEKGLFDTLAGIINLCIDRQKSEETRNIVTTEDIIKATGLQEIEQKSLFRKLKSKGIVRRPLTNAEYDFEFRFVYDVFDKQLHYNTQSQCIADAFSRIPNPVELMYIRRWHTLYQIGYDVIIEYIKKMAEIFPETTEQSMRIGLPYIMGLANKNESENKIVGFIESYQLAANICSQMNQTKEPSAKELEYCDKWLHKDCLTAAAIALCCEQTVNAGTPNFDYLNGVIENYITECGENTVTEETIKKQSQKKEELKQILYKEGIYPPKDKEGMSRFINVLSKYDLGMITLAAKYESQNWKRSYAMPWTKIVTRINKWTQAGICTIEAASKKVEQQILKQSINRIAEELYQQWGTAVPERIPSQEKNFIRKWIVNNVSEELILYAGGKASRDNIKAPFAYMDTILKAYHNSGIKTEKQAIMDDYIHQKQTKPDDDLPW